MKKTLFFFLHALVFLCFSGCGNNITKPPPNDGKKQRPVLPQGTKVWQFKMDDSITATPTLKDGKLYVASWSGQISALNPMTGQAFWTTRTTPSGIISQAMTVGDKTLYASSSSNYLFALEPKNGKEKWRFQTKFSNYGSPLIDEDQTRQKTIYLASNDAYLYALNPNDGKEKWRFEADSGMRASPIASPSSLFIGDVRGVIHALTKDGKRQWRYKVTGHQIESLKTRVTKEKLQTIAQGWIISAPVFADNTVFFGVAHSLAGSLYALDAKTGKERWKVHMAGQIEATPLYHQGTIYVGSNDFYLYAIDAKNGKEKWKFRTENTVQTKPTIVGNQIYITSADQYVYALNKDSGLPIWEFKAPDSIYSGIIAYKGILYFGCMDESIYAIKAPSLSTSKKP